jgi:hypothetical protein
MKEIYIQLCDTVNCWYPTSNYSSEKFFLVVIGQVILKAIFVCGKGIPL